jgi:hypothetical protein
VFASANRKPTATVKQWLAETAVQNEDVTHWQVGSHQPPVSSDGGGKKKKEKKEALD